MSEKTDGMNEYDYREWCQAVNTLLHMVQAQHLRFGNELAPRTFVGNLRFYADQMEKLLPTNKEAGR